MHVTSSHYHIAGPLIIFGLVNGNWLRGGCYWGLVVGQLQTVVCVIPHLSHAQHIRERVGIENNLLAIIIKKVMFDMTDLLVAEIHQHYAVLLGLSHDCLAFIHHSHAIHIFLERMLEENVSSG